ncbi:hypothetical protein O181_019857 [Austropuccinia psidii MF-1]|uniref:Conserved oligomeric Golgi complex subunit 4 n=1 Tax=Austropuccinia psidii MF-1 TaxID=1389203 RepID=A0A9Q3CAL7_9BASI|nr:hypothetical protein [Austropuccinia psidii MF-1]
MLTVETNPIAPATSAELPQTEDHHPVYSKQRLAALNSHLDLINALTHLEASEYKIDQSLSQLLSSPDRIESSLDTIGHLKPNLSSLTHDALTLHEIVTERAAVAERISGKVRVLDLEQSRVTNCIDRVQSATELKDALSQLFLAIERADWEAATRHVQRANALDRAFLTSQFAQAVVPTTDIPDPPAVALENFISQLTKIFLKSFNCAARAKDEVTTTRFFKLFPLLGPSALKAGLEAYSEFVGTLVSLPSSTSRPSDTSRTTSILSQFTSVFEQLALIIDQHQNLVDKYYGPWSMVTVALHLNKEMDRLVDRLVTSWHADRQLERKLIGTQRYAFPGLTQLLLGPNPLTMNSINSQTALQSSLRSFAGNVQRTHPSQSHSNTLVASEGDNEDPREIDGLLGELAGMSSRWQTYRRFLHSRFTEEDFKPVDEAPPSQALPPNSSSPTKPEIHPVVQPVPSTSFNRHLSSLEATKLAQKLNELLEGVYLPLETWYLRVNIEKAHLSNEPDFNTCPYLSSALDDVFYITKKVIIRLINVGSVDCAQKGLLKIQEIIERDFGEVMKKRLETLGTNMGPTAAVGFGISSKVGEEKEKKEKLTRNSYIVYLNNLSMASEYTIRLVEEIFLSPTLSQNFFIPHEISAVKASFETFLQAEKKFLSIAKSGLEQLFNQLIRPRLRSMLSDCYKDVTYVLNDESYAEAELQDICKKRFCKAWETLMGPYKESLTSQNFHEFFSMTIHALVRPWETVVRNMKFNELGSLRFDKDLRSITSYLSSQTNFGVSLINESFIRLRQISMLLGLDEAEEDLKDFLVSEEVVWRLTMSEIKGILSQKIAAK